MAEPTLINLNDAAPAAATGFMLAKWQKGSPYPTTVDINGQTITVDAADVSAEVRNLGGVDPRTTVSETIALDSQGMLVTFDNASPIAVLLDSVVGVGFLCAVDNLGVGLVTFTPSSGTINGAATLDLASGTGGWLFFDGVNWEAVVGGGGGVPTSRTISTTAPLTGGGDLSADRTLDVNVFGGDAGAGGSEGTVPAPVAGDAAAGKYLKASGGWVTPPTGGGLSGVNSQAGDYTADATDNAKLIVMSKATVKTLTLPASPPSATWMIFVGNSGAGALTIDRNGLSIDGVAANLTLQQYQGLVIYTDGSNYFTARGQPNFGAQNANQFLAGPSPGVPAEPIFRYITSADLPIGIRADVVLDAGTIAAGAGVTGSVALGKSSLLYQIVAAFKCRLRLYATAASRDNAVEIIRPWGTLPSQSIDLLLDITWGGVAPQTYPINPKAVLENKDGSPTTAIYYNVTSRELASQDFTFTLTRLLLEN